MQYNSQSREKCYIGELEERNGERSYTHTFRFMTAGDPAAYIEDIASAFYDEEGGEPADSGYYFNGGELHVQPRGFKEIDPDLYPRLDGIVTAL